MQDKRSRRMWVLGLVALLLLSLPMVAAAQTGSGTSTTSTSTAAVAQTNGISSPKNGAALSGTVEVRGYATSPNFMKWQLDLLPNSDPNAAIFLAVGETEGAFTYSFDTSNLPAGEHSLRLRVVREDSNYDEYLTKFTIGQAPSTTVAGTTGTKAATGTTATTGTKATGTAGAAATGATGANAAAATGAGVTTNGLAAPKEGQAVSGDFVVRGFANDPNFMKWQLDLLPGGDANSAVFLAVGETPGVFTYTLSTANLPLGQHALRLRVVRNDSNYTEYLTQFVIGAVGGAGKTTATTASKETAAAEGAASAATQAKEGETAKAGSTAGAAATTNGITSPKSGATVSGTITVRGYANNPNFMKWQLDLLPNGDATQAAFLAFGEQPGEFTYTLDTTGLPAGEHALRLRVVRTDSNYDEYLTKFTIK